MAGCVGYVHRTVLVHCGCLHQRASSVSGGCIEVVRAASSAKNLDGSIIMTEGQPPPLSSGCGHGWTGSIFIMLCYKDLHFILLALPCFLAAIAAPPCDHCCLISVAAVVVDAPSSSPTAANFALPSAANSSGNPGCCCGGCWSQPPCPGSDSTPAPPKPLLAARPITSLQSAWSHLVLISPYPGRFALCRWNMPKC